MKKLLFVLCMILAITASSQTYVSTSYSIFNGVGSFKEKSEVTVEVGKYFTQSFTGGLAIGKMSLAGGDTINYAELRPTLYYADGKFSQGITIGVGKIFNAKNSFLTEYCTSTNYAINDHWGVSIFFGGYNFDGRYSSQSYTFFGTGLCYTFSKPNNGKKTKRLISPHRKLVHKKFK